MLEVIESTMPAASCPASVSGGPSSLDLVHEGVGRVEAFVDRSLHRVRVQIGRALELADDVLERGPPVGRGRAEVARPGLARGLLLAAAAGGQSTDAATMRSELLGSHRLLAL